MMTEALMHALQAAALWSGLLILMLLVLSGMVVSGRRRHMVSFGDGGHPDLLAASRAFGNCVEYATPGMAAMALLALVSGQAWMVHAVGATLLAGRILHALGLMLQTGPSVGRVLGMALTYTAIGVAAALSGQLFSALLQNPWVLGAFASLFVLLGLSMFGLFDLRLPLAVSERLHRWSLAVPSSSACAMRPAG